MTAIIVSLVVMVVAVGVVCYIAGDLRGYSCGLKDGSANAIKHMREVDE